MYTYFCVVFFLCVWGVGGGVGGAVPNNLLLDYFYLLLDCVYLLLESRHPPYLGASTIHLRGRRAHEDSAAHVWVEPALTLDLYVCKQEKSTSHTYPGPKLYI